MDTDPSFREFVPVDYDESWQNLLENCFKDLQRYPSTDKVFHRKPAENRYICTITLSLPGLAGRITRFAENTKYMAETDIIYSVKDIFEHERFKDMTYCIPDYQRGYKWTSENVRLLLKDIGDFKPIRKEEFYCLQNITIIRIPKEDNHFNVIDGQQRLTTLFILLCFLGETSLVSGKVNYEIRETTSKFLQQEVLTRKCWSKGYNHQAQHQDEHYILNAAEVIAAWFDGYTEDETADFKNKLLLHTKLIVNEVNGDECQTFSNLNGVRVPLDASDLIRAMLVTYSVKEDKEGVEIEPYRVRMGAEIDSFAVEWSNIELKQFYMQFLPEKLSRESKDRRFDYSEHPINLLYLLFLIQEKGEQAVSLAVFEDYLKKEKKAYAKLKEFEADLQEWFNNTELYHFLGYLIFNHKGKQDVSFTELYAKWKECATRTGFLHEVKRIVSNCILSDFVPTEQEQEDGIRTNREKLIKDIRFNLETNWYVNANLPTILILNDILIAIRATSLNRLPVRYLRVYNEDREHISCQTPNDKELNNKERWLADLTDLEKFEVEDSQKIDFQKSIVQLRMKIQGADEITRDLKQEIIGTLTKFGLNSIGNIVLLNSSVNRGYGNSPFVDKRLAIINNYFDNKTDDVKRVKSRNAYIRPYTLKTFLSNLGGEESEQHTLTKDNWRLSDIKANAEAIASAVESFLNEAL